MTDRSGYREADIFVPLEFGGKISIEDLREMSRHFYNKDRGKTAFQAIAGLIAMVDQLRALKQEGVVAASPEAAKQRSTSPSLDVVREALEAQLTAANILCKRAKEGVAVMTVASCDCLTKTPDPAYHTDACRYRRLEAVLSDLNALSFSITRALSSLPVGGEG